MMDLHILRDYFFLNKGLVKGLCVYFYINFKKNREQHIICQSNHVKEWLQHVSFQAKPSDTYHGLMIKSVGG